METNRKYWTSLLESRSHHPRLHARRCWRQRQEGTSLSGRLNGRFEASNDHVEQLRCQDRPQQELRATLVRRWRRSRIHGREHQ